MILAIRLHYMRSRANAEARSKELFSVKWTSLILALCIFVAMGRFMSLL
jgi:hypothetical protein